VSLGIVVVELLRGEVVYLHINREREFWCSPGTTLFRPDRGVTLAAAERIYRVLTPRELKNLSRQLPLYCNTSTKAGIEQNDPLVGQCDILTMGLYHKDNSGMGFFLVFATGTQAILRKSTSGLQIASNGLF
jgi:hypothetical protein